MDGQEVGGKELDEAGLHYSSCQAQLLHSVLTHRHCVGAQTRATPARASAEHTFALRFQESHGWFARG